jgi:two-component system response regulator HydG
MVTDTEDADSAPAALPSTPAAAAVDLSVLVVDDEPNNLTSLEKIFKKEGWRVLGAANAREGLDQLRKFRVDVVLTDLMMPGISGIELLRAVKEVSPDTEVVLMTAFGTVEVAVQAMREGAYDFVEKPLKRLAIVKSVRKAAERRELLAENRSLRQELKALTEHSIVGQSPALRRVLEVVAQAAPSTATVLVLGESGTGKELIARSVHSKSGRTGPFVAVNCAAIPESILEAELFGHERGAFTGAVNRREGRFARAAGGTIFLDEIGELAPAVQVKLLRVLQEGEFEPIGGRTQRADARVVAATNRDLKAEVQAGRFREDLYYRLNVIAVTAPPLRARREDVPLLVDHFLVHFARKNGKPVLKVLPEVMNKLLDYSWPGNVRELENAIERAVVLSRSDTLQLGDLPESVSQSSSTNVEALTFPIGTPLDEVEHRLIRETLKYTSGDKALAAQLLGISSRTIYRKLGDAEGTSRSETE